MNGSDVNLDCVVYSSSDELEWVDMFIAEAAEVDGPSGGSETSCAATLPFSPPSPALSSSPPIASQPPAMVRQACERLLDVPRKAWRLKAKKLYVTVPHCDRDPDDVLADILQKFAHKRVKWVIVAREKHADGSFHIHCALWLMGTYDSKRVDDLDWIGGKHGNYQVMKDAPGCVAYITKDNVFAAHGIDVVAYLAAVQKKQSTSFAQVAVEMQITGTSLADLNNVHPGFMLQHLSKVTAYATFLDSVQSRADRSVWPDPMSDAQEESLDAHENLIYRWILENMWYRNGEAPPNRPFGTLQLMIIALPGAGKTSLLNCLTNYARAYYVNMEENFYCGYSDAGYDFIVLDEFRSQKTTTFMNAFVQGAPIKLRTKGGVVLKRKNLPVIICSNYQPARSYHKVQQNCPEALTAFLRRYMVIDVPGDGDLYTVCNWLAGEESNL